MMALLICYPCESAVQHSLPVAAIGIHLSGAAPLPTWEGLSLTADVRLDNRSELCAALSLDAGGRAAAGWPA